MNREEKELYVDSDAYNRAIADVAANLCKKFANDKVVKFQLVEYQHEMMKAFDVENLENHDETMLKISMNAYQIAAPNTKIGNLALEHIRTFPTEDITNMWDENRTLLEMKEEALENAFFNGHVEQEDLIQEVGALKFEYDNLERMGDDYKDISLFPALNPN